MQTASFSRVLLIGIALWTFVPRNVSGESPAIAPSRLTELHGQLEADEFVLRERATEELTTIGTPAIAVVAKAVESPSLETSTRAFGILKAWLEGDDEELSQRTLATIETLAKHPSPAVARRALALQGQAAAIAEKAARSRLIALGAEFGRMANGDEQDEGRVDHRVLRIGKGWKGTPADLALIRRLDRLAKLSFSDSAITPLWLKAMEGVQVAELDLSKTDLDDDGLLALPKLGNLTQLDLRETLIGDDGVDGLLRQEKLERLLLRGTLISDEGLIKLKALPALKQLQLSKTRISKRGFAALSEFPSLEILDVQQTKFSYDALQALAVSKTLRTIHGAGSSMTIVDVQDFEKKYPDSRLKVHTQPSSTPFGGDDSADRE